MEFQAFPKMARLSREVIITEKIDGTNAQVFIYQTEDGEVMPPTASLSLADSGGLLMFAGSRNRYITVENDNQGFARWVKEHAEDLFRLGPGRHYGEWWGSNIQRGYGLTNGERRFSLFNALRWAERGASLAQIPNPDPRIVKKQQYPPDCCGVVPVLYKGEFSTTQVDDALRWLEGKGSMAAPGYMNAEGVVVYHTQGNIGFKKTILHDEQPKGKVLANA
jgi:hypothetical protein